MLKNYLKIAFRSLLKNKLYSSINLLGLALGLASVLIIGLWIQEQFSYDRFHTNKDQLYQILENQNYSGEILTFAATPGPMIPAMKAEIPEIAFASRSSWGGQEIFEVDGKILKERGLYVDPDFLKMFSFPLLEGDKATVLQDPQGILISEKLAEKYFPGQEAIGQSILLNTRSEFQVSGIFADVPENSTFQFDYLLPFSVLEKENDWMQSWNNNGIRSYFQLQDGLSVKVEGLDDSLSASPLEHKIRTFVRDRSTQDNVELIAQPFSDVYLKTDYKNGKYQGGGNISSVRLFAVIALFILIIACINFMNLSTARSSTRAKEVGIRRVSGASRSTLIKQFMGESLLISILAGGLAVLIVQMAIPSFNQLFNSNLSLNFGSTQLWMLLLGTTLGAGFMAGLYPAFFLSRFRPVVVLKGFISKGGKSSVWFRQGMVITQFALATILIISTLVVFLQMSHIRKQNLGYKKDNLLYFRVDQQLMNKYPTVKSELLNLPEIAHVSATTGQFFSWGNNTSGVSWEGKDPASSILFQRIPIDYDFLSTIGAELKEGRAFSREFPSDSTSYMINERAAALMGMENPIGQRIQVNGQEGQVVGLVKDYYVGSLHRGQDPVIMNLGFRYGFWYARLNTANTEQVLEKMKNILKEHSPNYPFDFAFVDTQYDQLYRAESRISTLSKLFAFLSILVCCLGLFGLATFIAEQRTKEIGIRKVLGASVIQLSNLLSISFLKLVMIGFFIAVPFAWMLTSNWLDRFAIRISLSLWIFLLAGLIGLGIAFFTISLKTLQAASNNPVKALRAE